MPLLFDSSAFRELYLVFLDDISYPFSRFIATGFKHVFVIERQGLGWMCIDPSRDDLSATILPASYHVDIIPQFKKNNPDSHIIKLHVKPNSKGYYPRPHLMSCVSTVQYILGVYWPHILTPRMLYNKIINNQHPSIKVVEP